MYDDFYQKDSHDGRSLDLDGLNRSVEDDPFTITYAKLEMINPTDIITEDGTTTYKPITRLKTEGCWNINGETVEVDSIIIPVKPYAIEVAWIRGNYAFGVVNISGKSTPVAYEIASGVLKVSRGNPLCWRRDQWYQQGFEHCRSDHCLKLNGVGEAVIDYLTTAHVEKDQAKQGLNYLSNGKFNVNISLVKVHDKNKNRWTKDGKLLDVIDLLKAVGGIQ